MGEDEVLLVDWICKTNRGRKVKFVDLVSVATSHHNLCWSGCVGLRDWKETPLVIRRLYSFCTPLMWIATSWLMFRLSFTVAHCQSVQKFCSAKKKSLVPSIQCSSKVFHQQSSTQKLKHRRQNALPFSWICDYHSPQAKVQWWYSEPLEIWQKHPLDSSAPCCKSLLGVWITVLLPRL